MCAAACESIARKKLLKHQAPFKDNKSETTMQKQWSENGPEMVFILFPGLPFKISIEIAATFDSRSGNSDWWCPDWKLLSKCLLFLPKRKFNIFIFKLFFFFMPLALPLAEGIQHKNVYLGNNPWFQASAPCRICSFLSFLFFPCFWI